LTEENKVRLDRLRAEAAALHRKIEELEEANRRLRYFIEQLELDNEILNRELGEMLEEVKIIQDEKEEKLGGGVPIERGEEISG